MCVQPNVIGQKITTTKNTSTGKYMTQMSPNISNMSQTPCMSTVPYRSNELLQGNDQRVTTTYRTIQPTEARTTASKSITMINHPVHVNAENNCQQPVKRDAEWNQLYVFERVFCCCCYSDFFTHLKTIINDNTMFYFKQQPSQEWR